MHDRNGIQLAEGDTVWIKARVKRTWPGAANCNVEVEIDEPQDAGNGDRDYSPGEMTVGSRVVFHSSTVSQRSVTRPPRDERPNYPHATPRLQPEAEPPTPAAEERQPPEEDGPAIISGTGPSPSSGTSKAEDLAAIVEGHRNDPELLPEAKAALCDPLAPGETVFFAGTDDSIPFVVRSYDARTGATLVDYAGEGIEYEHRDRPVPRINLTRQFPENTGD